MFLWCENCKKNFKLITFLNTKQLNFTTDRKENLFPCCKTSGNTVLKQNLGKVAQAVTGPHDAETNLLAILQSVVPLGQVFLPS